VAPELFCLPFHRLPLKGGISLILDVTVLVFLLRNLPRHFVLVLVECVRLALLFCGVNSLGGFGVLSLVFDTSASCGNLLSSFSGNGLCRRLVPWAMIVPSKAS